jgi:hypothetical protein
MMHRGNDPAVQKAACGIPGHIRDTFPVQLRYLLTIYGRTQGFSKRTTGLEPATFGFGTRLSVSVEFGRAEDSAL